MMLNAPGFVLCPAFLFPVSERSGARGADVADDTRQDLPSCAASGRAAQRAALLKQLFTTGDNGIGVSYLRVSIGSSDMNEHVYSYDDLPPGETDVEMVKFNLGADRAEVIPVLKEIQAIRPEIKILGSPWSAPAWMKTNNDVKAGHLRPEYYAA